MITKEQKQIILKHVDASYYDQEKIIKYLGMHDMQAHPDSWYLELLVVAAEYKGQGIGSKMLNECIKPYVLLHGGESVTLITNTAQNCRFYKKNGFTEFAHSILTYNDDSVDNWSFCCALNTC